VTINDRVSLGGGTCDEVTADRVDRRPEHAFPGTGTRWSAACPPAAPAAPAANGHTAAPPARPGGNITGLSVESTDLGKRVEILHEVVSDLRRLASTDMREHVLIFCLLGQVLIAAIMLLIAPEEVTWALSLIDEMT